MPYQIPDKFYYQHAVTSVAYSNHPQNKLNIHRLIRQEPCWESKMLEYTLKPKTLILADWTLAYRDDYHFDNIEECIKFWLSSGFEIYVWLERDFVKVEHPTFIVQKQSYSADFTTFNIYNIYPETSQAIIEKAVLALGIPKDQLFVLQSNHIDQYSGMLLLDIEGYEDMSNKYILNTNYIIDYCETHTYLPLYEFLIAELPNIDGRCGQEDPLPPFEFLSKLKEFPEFFDDDTHSFLDYCKISDLKNYEPNFEYLYLAEHVKRLKIAVEIFDDSPSFDQLFNLRKFNGLLSISLILRMANECTYTLQDFAILFQANCQTLKVMHLESHFINCIQASLLSKPFEVLNHLVVSFSGHSVDENQFHFLISQMPKLDTIELRNMPNVDCHIDLQQIKTLRLGILNLNESVRVVNQSIINSLNHASSLEYLSLKLDANLAENDLIWQNPLYLNQLRSLLLSCEGELEYFFGFATHVRPLIEHAPNLEYLYLENMNFSEFTQEDNLLLSNIEHFEIKNSSLNSTFCRQSFPNLKRLTLCNGDIKNCFEDANFPALTHLAIENTTISETDLKELIKAAPNLLFLTLIDCHIDETDEELTQLIKGTQYYLFSQNDNDFKEESDEDEDYQEELSNKNEDDDEIDLGFEVSLTTFIPSKKKKDNKHLSAALDSRTVRKSNNQKLIAKIIFKSENDCPEPDWRLYRLYAYDMIDLSSFKNFSSRADGEAIFEDRGYSTNSYYSKNPPGVYRGEYELEISNEWIALPSLSIDDNLIELYTYPAIPNIKTQYSNRYHQYFISVPELIKPKKVRVVFRIESVPMVLNVFNDLPSDISKKIRQLKSFKEGALVGDCSTPAALIETMEREKKGACRHRAPIFKKFASEHNIPCRLIGNDVHEFIEFYYNDIWYGFDLGGFPAKVQTIELPQSKKQQEFEQKRIFEKQVKEKLLNLEKELSKELEFCFDHFLRNQFKMEFFNRCSTLITSEVTDFEIQKLIQSNEKQKPFRVAQMFEKEISDYLKKPCQAEFNDHGALVEYLTACKDSSRILIDIKRENSLSCSLILQRNLQVLGFQVFVAHSTEDLICSSYLAKQEDGYGVKQSPGGLFYQFLSSQHAKLVLIIDYTHFKPDEIARFSHSLFDREPKADGVEVPKQLQIIGIFDSKDKDAYLGGDFIGRFHQQVIVKFSPSLPQPFIQAEQEYVIELSASSNWQAQLFGQWEIRNGRVFFVEPIQHQIPKNVRVVFNNPPMHEPSFNRFYLEEMMSRPLLVAQTTTLNWRDVKISPLSALSEKTLVLNLETISDFHKKFDLNPAGFNLIPGYMEQHAGQSIEIFVNDFIDEMAFDEIFQLAKKYHCHIMMAFDSEQFDDMMTPYFEDFEDKVGRLVCDRWSENIICTNDSDLYIADLKVNQGQSAHEQPSLVIHVDDLGIEDLFYKFELETSNDVSILRRKEQDLYRKLEQGIDVILTGKFSKKLSLSLSALLIQEYENQIFRYLKIVNENGLPGLAGQNISINLDAKILFLMREFSPGHIECENLKKSYIELRSRLEFKRRFPGASTDELFAGLSEIKNFEWNQLLNFDTSAFDCLAFCKHRKKQVYQTLKRAPYVYLSGLTGVGKSQFVEKECFEHQLFKEKIDLLQWAQARPVDNEFLILFFDEANLADSQWMGFEGMFASRPYIFVEGQLFELSINHKIIFAGNPAQYGDDRKIPELIQRHGLSIVFEPLSPAFIFDKMIYPLMINQKLTGYHPLLGKNLAYQAAPIVLEMYQFLLQLSQRELLVTPRQIETICLMFLANYEKDMDELSFSVEVVFQFYCHEVFESCLSKHYYQIFANRFPKPDRPYPAYSKIKDKIEAGDFLVTLSRQEAIEKILDFLSLEGGLNRLVIEGEPGIGKSDLTLKLLKALYEENNEFVYMPASLSLSEKKELMLQAFDLGQIVFTDELNSSVFFEQMLNSLLDNKHPDEKGRAPYQPGFKLIGTQNGIQLTGRNLESPALKSRSMYIRLPKYTPEEVFSIAVSMGVDELYASALEIAYAESKASFRQVLNWVNNAYIPQKINPECSFFLGLSSKTTEEPIEEPIEDFDMIHAATTESIDDLGSHLDWRIDKLEMSPFSPSETTLLGWFNDRDIEGVRGANNHERKIMGTMGFGSQNS